MVIVVENGTAIAGYVEIRPAVIVKVSYGDALAVMSFTPDSGFFGDVGEGAVAVVVIKRRA